MPTKSWKNHLKKFLTNGSWEFFFSAAPTAQTSPELHFCFVNSFIQPSRVGSLSTLYILFTYFRLQKKCSATFIVFDFFTGLGLFQGFYYGIFKCTPFFFLFVFWLYPGLGGLALNEVPRGATDQVFIVNESLQQLFISFSKSTLITWITLSL